MSEPRELRATLRRIRSRELLNRALVELRSATTGVLAVLLAVVLWNALAPADLGLGLWLPAAVGVALVAVHAARLWRHEPLAAVAARMDRRADLHDELLSAWWFARQAAGSDWVRLHLEHAEETSRRLDPCRLVPLRAPAGLHVPALLAVAVAVATLAPLPRAGELLAQRLAEIELPALEREPVAELQEAGIEPEEAAAATGEPAAEMQLPVLDEERPQEEALPEEPTAAAGEQQATSPEGETGTEGQEQTPGEQQPVEPGEESEGERVPVDNPEQVPGTQGQQASPDPSASQQQGEGEPAEEQGAMLPGGDEVFLQEGGEEMQRAPQADEDMGHATRQGGGEEELEEGEALTPLEVQLQREILALPEDPSSAREEEEPEEEVTRAEESLLELQAIDPGAEFGRQELLSGEPIPWRYRSLVLSYFRALRERDNQQREESP